MPESTSVKWPQVKSALASLDKPELVALLKDLFDHSIESRAFLSARFLPEGVPDAILDKYRRRIVEQFLPKRGGGKLDLRSARRTIRDYRKATSDLAGTVDLVLTYVESGTDFTNQFGDALGTATSTSLSTTALNPCWMKSLYPAHGRAAEDCGRRSTLSALSGSRESAGESGKRC